MGRQSRAGTHSQEEDSHDRRRAGSAEVWTEHVLVLSLRVMKGDNSIIVNLNNYGHSYQIVHKAVIKKGWKLATKQGEFWDVGWSDSNKGVQAVAKMSNHRYLGPVQRVNHFPGICNSLLTALDPVN